jgi:hypothetical protein
LPIWNQPKEEERIMDDEEYWELPTEETVAPEVKVVANGHQSHQPKIALTATSQVYMNEGLETNEICHRL